MTTPITRFTNGVLARGDQLEHADLYVDATTGKIINGQEIFFSSKAGPVKTIDLGGRILSPGFIDVQLNGCYGMDFSLPIDNYADELTRVKRELVKTGVTSFLPTLTSQKSEVYAKTLPFLGADQDRNSEDGAESLGTHCEGPFINLSKCGIHKPEVLQAPTNIEALDLCYGKQLLRSPIVKMVTIAPELDTVKTIIPELRRRSIISSIGHSAASYDEALDAVTQGSTMVTHLYNAMPQPHHRDTGIVGLLGTKDIKRPYFGLIADGTHVHPSMARIAYQAYPEGCCLVTDAMFVLGLPDGRYPWTNDEFFVKKGDTVLLERTGGIAGSAVTLLACLNNLLAWTGISIAKAIQTVTSNPAKMLGLGGIKGSSQVGADADLVILSQSPAGLVLDQVWKLGELVHDSKAQNLIKARL